MCLVKMNLTYKSSLARVKLQLQETESKNKNRFVLSGEIFLNFLSAALLAHAFDCAS